EYKELTAVGAAFFCNIWCAGSSPWGRVLPSASGPGLGMPVRTPTPFLWYQRLDRTMRRRKTTPRKHKLSELPSFVQVGVQLAYGGTNRLLMQPDPGQRRPALP